MVRALRKAGLLHTLNQSFKAGEQRPASDDKVRSLDLADGVTDAGLEALVGLPALQSLQLWGPNVSDRTTRVTNKGVTILLEKKQLKQIDLAEKLIDDETLNLFHTIGRLEVLSNTVCKFGEPRSSANVIGIELNNTRVTDEGLKLLKAYSKLEFVNVHNSRVTAAGVAELKKTFPKLDVIDNDG